MPGIVIAGAGATGASIALNLALRGARNVVLAERGSVAGGATSKAMGGIRQQFTTAEEVALARASIRFFEELGTPFFHQVGYVFLATTAGGSAELDARLGAMQKLGVPVERTDVPAGVRGDDVTAAVACWEDGLADPPGVASELVRRAAALGVEVREGTPAEELENDVLVIACGPWSAELGARYGVALPVRPLCRQLLATGAVEASRDLPMVVEHETGFHFRRRHSGAGLVLAMADPEPRWGFEERVDETVYGDRLQRLAHRYPAAAGTAVVEGWAGLYDMTPDAHPIIGWVGDGVYAACGFSGHGFMQSPAVGVAVADEILSGGSELDLTPFRLERFGAGASFPEKLVL